MAQEKRRILFVGGISALMSENEIHAHFEKFGAVTKVRIMKEKKTKEPKGYAYVTMRDCHVIPQILNLQHTIGDRKVDCQLASRKGEKKLWKDEQRKRRAFVTNLPPVMDSDQLFHLFHLYGAIRNAYIICDYETKVSKGYGYVEYLEPESASRALKAHVGNNLNDSGIQCLPYLGRHEQKISSHEAEDEDSVSDAAKDVHKPRSLGLSSKDQQETAVGLHIPSAKFSENKSGENLVATSSGERKLLLRPTPLCHQDYNLRFNIGCEPHWLSKVARRKPSTRESAAPRF